MEKNILHRKERLIITAVEIIDDLGIQGLSTREIAKRQEVSEATLFRHFKNKNELLVAVLDYFAKFDLDIYNSAKLKKPEEVIHFFIKSYAEYYENYPAITSILQIFDVLRYEPDLKDKVIEIYDNRNKYLSQLIEEVQQKGVLRSDVNNEVLANIILGTNREICLKWRIHGKYFSLRSEVLSVLNEILRTFA